MSNLEVFLTASSYESQMNQTNVTASLTATFKLANVLKANDYQRVSCTKIRCAIATFACNDGGFETSFFARHFMKNREETTNLHYNLLSNRRHALNIAMQLYKSFSGVDGEEINVNAAEVDKLMTSMTINSKNSEAENVVKWLLKHNPDISRKELADIKFILHEKSAVDFTTNTTTFYGGHMVRCYFVFCCS